MAENTRGQNTDGQRNKKASRQEQTKSTIVSKKQELNTDCNVSDMHNITSVGNRGRTRGSGIMKKEFFFDSYFDGQLSDE